MSRKTMFGRTNPKFIKYKPGKGDGKRDPTLGKNNTPILASIILAFTVTFLLNTSEKPKEIVMLISKIGYILLVIVIIALIMLAIVRNKKLKKIKDE